MSLSSSTAKTGLGRSLRLVILAICACLAGIGLWQVHESVHLTVVHGHSMEPTYQTGDLVLSVRTGTYARGDIITYHPAALPCAACNVVHRIIAGDGAGWITRGDNNPTADPWQPTAEEIVGVAVWHLSVPHAWQVLYLPQLWLCLLGVYTTVAAIQLLQRERAVTRPQA